MNLISLLWRYTGELIRPTGSMGGLSHCLGFLLYPDNYNVNDWVLKETQLGRILNSARAALRTGESVQTLSRFLIRSGRKIGPYYTAFSEPLIIVFVRDALFISRSHCSDCKVYSRWSKSLWYHPNCCWEALNLFPLSLPPSLPPAVPPSLCVSPTGSWTGHSRGLFILSLSHTN